MLRRLTREQDGTVLVIVAVALLVIILLGAIIVDTGNWFTHRRQLQNRADAAAFAAGVAFEKNWQGCVQTADAAEKAAAETEIVQTARKYAGDPTYGGGLFNTEVAGQSRVTVNVNKVGYNAGDASDGGPCFDHPPNAADEITPQGGFWADVKVKESSVPLFFGGFGISAPTITARARVEIRPALSDNGFIPLAVPDERIEQAQARFFNECTGAQLGAPIGLVQLAAADQVLPQMSLWGNADSNNHNTPISLQLPTAAGCPGGDYVPVGVQVRLSGLPASKLDINQTCAALRASAYADCYSNPNLMQVRTWKNGDPTTGPVLVKDASLTGGTCSPDGYFSRVTGCSYGASVDVDWGDRDDGVKNVSPNFHVSIDGVDLVPPGPTTPSGVWSTLGAPLTAPASGAKTVTVVYSWEDRNVTHSWRGQACTAGNNTPCKDPATGNNGTPRDVHRVFVGNDLNAGVVQLVKLTNTPSVIAPVSSFDSVPATGNNVPVYLTVGLKTRLTAGQFTTLRASSAQGSQSLTCVPGTGQGHDFDEFRFGCADTSTSPPTPYWYGVNAFPDVPPDTAWWLSPAPGSCPVKSIVFARPNTPSSPWRCVPTSPGLSPGVIADGIAARTGNCTNIQNNNCSKTQCLKPNHYSDYLAGHLDPSDPRIVKVFVVPYGAFKTTNGSTDSVPVLDFATFYVTGWEASGNANADPCPGDDPAQSGEIVGHFITFTAPAIGPVDENVNCKLDQIRPCRVVLVR